MRNNTLAALNAFMARKACKPSKSIWTDGVRIYSYSTIIASWLDNGHVAFCSTKYSQTTTTHQNALRAGMLAAGLQLVDRD